MARVLKWFVPQPLAFLFAAYWIPAVAGMTIVDFYIGIWVMVAQNLPFEYLLNDEFDSVF